MAIATLVANQSAEPRSFAAGMAELVPFKDEIDISAFPICVTYVPHSPYMSHIVFKLLTLGVAKTLGDSSVGFNI